MKINVIVTYSDKFIIGDDDKIPWHYDEINKYFDSITMLTNDIEKKNAIIMGYNTYVMNGIIEDRVNIIITTKDLKENNTHDLFFVDSISSSIELCKKLIYDKYIENIFIIGGEQIYSYYFKSYYYKFLDKVYITRINKKYEGNKYFYGLEEKFYYTTIKKSDEIEYRVLQHDCDFINAEMTYLYKLQDLLINDDIIVDDILKTKILKSYGFELEINLSKYFPIFNIIKDIRKNILSNIFLSFKTDEIKNSVKNIINKSSSTLNLIGIKPYDSIYNFNFDNNHLSCNVKHTKGSMFNEVLCNIIFSSLLVVFISKIMKLTPYIIKYNCLYNYILESEKFKIDKIAWNTPDVLPILNVKDRSQCNIEDFIFEDLDFLGINI